jgi:AcrR family transcriptional regulator
MPRKNYHHGALKQELMRAAILAIEARGQVDFNLREIAKASGVSVAAVYRHFASKNELLIALAEQGFKTLRHRFQAIMNDETLSKAEIRQALGMGYVHFAMEHEGLFRVMFCRELCQLPEFVSIESLANESLHILQSALEASQSLENCDASLAPAVLAAWSRVHGLAFLWIERNISSSAPAFLSTVEKILKDFNP